MDKRLLLIPFVLAVGGAGAYWWWSRGNDTPATLVLFGNVDLRQVALPFNNSERIAVVLVEEGDHVQRGQVLARLDVSRLKPQVDQAEAQAAAQRAVVERLRNGSRPEGSRKREPISNPPRPTPSTCDGNLSARRRWS